MLRVRDRKGLRPLLPFWGLDRDQLDRRWIDRGYGLEAILFRRSELADLDSFERILSEVGTGTELTLHFPMDANYLLDPIVISYLYRFIELAHRFSATGVVLHSNYIVEINALPAVDFSAVRGRFLEFFALLDDRIDGSGLWVGVENMPLVGDDGTDVDAVFVYPEDFSDFSFRNVGITFDTAHWVGAVDSTEDSYRRNLDAHLFPPRRRHGTLDFAGLVETVRHIHFGAVCGVSLPPALSVAQGGHLPASADANTYADVLKPFCGRDLTMSLEIAELDYSDRRNAWQAVEWLQEFGIIE